MASKTSPIVYGSVDKGWAWVIMIAMFAWNTLLAGTMKSFGILYLEFIDLYERGPVATSWMGCTFSLVLTLMAPLSGYVGDHVKMKTQRKLVMCLSVVMATGIAATGWMPTLEGAVIIYGVAGFAASLVDTPILSLLGKYFKRRRFLASGVVFAGSSFGTLVLPPIFTLLVDTYAIRGAMVVFGGVWLNVNIVGAVIRPIPDPITVTIEISNTDIEEENDKRSEESDPEVNGLTSKYLSSDIDDGLADVQMRHSTFSLQSFWINPFIGGSRRSLHGMSAENGPSTARRKSSSVPCLRMAATPCNLTASLPDVTIANKELTSDPDFSDRSMSKRVDRSGLERVETSDSEDGKMSDPEQFNDDVKSLSAGTASDMVTCWSLARKAFVLSKRVLAVLRDYWTFIRSPGLPMLMLTFFLASFAYFNQFFVFPPLARELGMTRIQGAFLVSVSNISELLSRIIVGLLIDSGKATKPFLIEVSFALSAVLAMAITFSTDHTMLFVYSATFGLLGGVFLPLAILLLVELVPITHISSASGLFALVTGTGISLGPPVLGAVKSLTGSFTDSLRLCSVFYVLAFIIYVFHEAQTLNCVKQCKRGRPRRELINTQLSVP